MSAKGNTELVSIRGRAEPQQVALDLGPDPTLPPATRAECPTERPCPKVNCNHNTTFERETPGRPHHGTHNAPKRILRNRNGEIVVNPRSCVLDELDASGGEPLKVGEVADVLGVDKRRVQQLADRGLDKSWVGMSLLEVVEAWAEVQLYPHGATLEHLWGVLVDEDGVEMRRTHDADRVVVSLVVNVKRFERPKPTTSAMPLVRKRKVRSDED